MLFRSALLDGDGRLELLGRAELRDGLEAAELCTAGAELQRQLSLATAPEEDSLVGAFSGSYSHPSWYMSMMTLSASVGVTPSSWYSFAPGTRPSSLVPTVFHPDFSDRRGTASEG